MPKIVLVQGISKAVLVLGISQVSLFFVQDRLKVVLVNGGRIRDKPGTNLGRTVDKLGADRR